MPQPDPLRVRAFAETWEHRRHNAVDASMLGSADNLRTWAETMNAQTRLLIAELQIFDPAVWGRIATICKIRAAGAALISPELLTQYRLIQPAFAEIQDPRLWDALEELANHSATMCSSAKFFVNKLDRTNV